MNKREFQDIKAKPKEEQPIGWEDIKDKKSGTVERKVTEDFLPGGPRERTITYEAPFDRCDREQDYATVWKQFENRPDKNKETIKKEPSRKRKSLAIEA